MPTRAEVYEAIDTEREYQLSFWPGIDGDSDNPHSIGEDILLLGEYVDRARAEWTKVADSPDMAALHMIRKVAGIAVRCMEHNGAPKRA